MAHSYHHALSSAKKWGGTPEEYLPVHQWFDESKMITADFRHRALRHHAEGIFMAETIFSTTLTLSTGRIIPVRWIGEQHVREDLGFIPSFSKWVQAIRPEPWMGRAENLIEVPNPELLNEGTLTTVPVRFPDASTQMPVPTIGDTATMRLHTK
jgi:hypothetical protein